MVVAEMRAAHVPVEILRLDVEREHVGDDGVQRRGHVSGCGRFEIGPCRQRSFAPLLEFFGFLRCEGGHCFLSVRLGMGSISAGACTVVGSTLGGHT